MSRKTTSVLCCNDYPIATFDDEADASAEQKRCREAFLEQQRTDPRSTYQHYHVRTVPHHTKGKRSKPKKAKA